VSFWHPESRRSPAVADIGVAGDVWIDKTGPAYELLDKAYDADLACDASAWAALPLRYGPYCSTWVLSEHPHATTKPGTD
jgi:hypothetical protein